VPSRLFYLSPLQLCWFYVVKERFDVVMVQVMA
jgi:hypothetical protein